MLTLLHGKAGDEEWNENLRKKLSPDAAASGPEILFKDAAFPVPFTPGLEYNSPAHGAWNIVHMGMLLPESHQIYVCGPNCNRGVVLTAAEMNAGDRFSFVEISEEDLFNGQMEDLVIDGVSEILHKLKKTPPVIFLFTVCVHHFMGCDIAYIYETLRKRFPNQCFVESYMDPIMQKEGLTPDQKLRAGLYAPLYDPAVAPVRTGEKKQIDIIGNDFPTREESELKQMLKAGGYTVKDITECETFAQYLEMADSCLNISCYPPAKYGAEKLSKKLAVKHLYLPFSFDYEENEQELLAVKEAAPDAVLPDINALKERCEKELRRTKELLGETKVTIDASAFPRILGLARLLLAHGIRVERIYADAFSPEEKEAYSWLRKNAPELSVCPTIHPAMRLYHADSHARPETDQNTEPAAGQDAGRGTDQGVKVLAIGQKAAYFSGTPYFVNIVEGGGLHGFDGITELCRLIREAYRTPKDTADLVVRKGLGCESCIMI